MDSESLVDEYLDALDALWRDRGNDGPGYKAMLPFAKRIGELQAERDALAKDAARYRWLQSGGMYRVGFDSIGRVPLDMLDAAIDAAMTEGKRVKLVGVE